jgi:endonuclease/exonuclease/phosphatase family metal-dependent hydrolase
VLFNTHFDQAGREARAQSARLLVSRLERFSALPRLVTADLNASEGSEPARILAGAGYRDTFRVLHPEADAGTFHGFGGVAVRKLGKIDYVLCDGKWDVLGAAVVRDERDGRFPSDHFPVTADLSLRRPERR